MAKYVWGFLVTERDFDEIPPPLEKIDKKMCHLIAEDLSEATIHANRYIVENFGSDSPDYEVTCLTRKMKLDYPLSTTDSET